MRLFLDIISVPADLANPFRSPPNKGEGPRWGAAMPLIRLPGCGGGWLGGAVLDSTAIAGGLL